MGPTSQSPGFCSTGNNHSLTKKCPVSRPHTNFQDAKENSNPMTLECTIPTLGCPKRKAQDELLQGTDLLASVCCQKRSVTFEV